jgi:quercetin dioxygenase-like cupin family protein
MPIVKQPEDCEIIYVRENTPMFFSITKATDGVSSVSIITEELIPGSAIPVHKHLHTDEYFVFIAGTGLITIDDKTYTFKPGTRAFVPKDTWHGLQNNGSEKVVFSFGFSPAGFEGFFREIGTPAGQIFKPKSPEERDAIAKKYGMVFK